MDFELQLAGLEIELTRDCNLKCPHCMRYEPEESMKAYRGSVISTEIIDALFERYRRIEQLLLTGGEPLLHPEMITYIIDKLIEKQVYTEQIQIITNGTIASEEAAVALNKAYDYITKNCVNWEHPVYIGISTDFHDNQSTAQDTYSFYKQHCKFDVEFHQPDLSNGKHLAVTHAGRAKTLSDTAKNFDAFHHKICTSPEGKILCMLDLTLSGNFVTGTHHSFQDADKPENILCSVKDNLLSAIVQWNFEHPLNCKETKLKEWVQNVADTGIYFGKKATPHDYKVSQDSVRYYNDTEDFRKEVHRQFPALYPDDIENISNLAEKQSWLYCQCYATHLNEKRSKESCTDTSCYCTCPDKEF